MRRQLITVIYFVLLSVLCSGCVKQKSAASEDIDWSVSKRSDTTGVDYEENATGVKAAFLTFEDKAFIIEEVQNWDGTKIAANTCYTYIHSDPDSWDAYIYYTDEDANVNYDSMMFYIEDSTVKLYITSSVTTAEHQPSYFLILIQAPSRGAWPNDVDVYIDDVQIENDIFNSACARDTVLPATPG